MPSVDVYENFLKQSQAVAGGYRRWAPPTQRMRFKTILFKESLEMAAHALQNNSFQRKFGNCVFPMFA